MISHALVGSNDLPKAKAFYDAVLEPLGAKPSRAMERIQFYSTDGTNIVFAICKPYDGGQASSGNGTMLSVPAPSRAVVDQVHATAVAKGGVSEGEPGARAPTFYAAYFRDLDGNKFCVFNRD